jgi:HAD superfamily hydrolase (TIGR01458 family)
MTMICMNDIRYFLIDIDGVLIRGDKIIEGADETMKYLEENMFAYVLVTNTTRMPKKTLIKELTAFGFKVDERRLLTTLSATIDYIKSKKENAKCYLIAPDESDADFQGTGLTITRNEEPVDFVVLGYDNRTDFKMLDSAFRLIKDGAKLVAMHEDKVFPGKPKQNIGLGAFVRSLEYSTNKKAIVIGKPSKTFFELSMKQISASAKETAMIGDSLAGDIIGAKNAGLKAIMVRTGNFDEKELDKSKIKPDYLIDSIRDLPDLLL